MFWSSCHLNINCFTGSVDLQTEANLVVQALRINTLSKLTFSDCLRFDALVRDVFQDVEFKDIEYESLAKAFREVCEELNLQVIERQVSIVRGFCRVFSPGMGQ